MTPVVLEGRLKTEPLVSERPNNFDLIRLTMALAVVWSHSFALYYGSESTEPISRLLAGTLNTGNISVNVFFIVSGFLITQSYERSSSVWSYLGKRVARIYPAYCVAVALCAFLLMPWYADVRYTPGTVLRTIGENLLLHGWFVVREPFIHNPNTSINGSLWSIPYEFWCYLGVLALGVFGFLRRERRVWIVVVLIVTVLRHAYLDALGKLPGGWYLSNLVFGWSYRWLQMAPYFLAGMLVHLYRERLPRSRWILVAGLGILIGLAQLPDRYGVVTVDIVAPCTIAYAVFYTAFAPQLVRAARYGDFSYGTYLYAYPIQQLLVATRAFTFPEFVPLAMALSLLAGVASWYGVERWFQRKRRPTDTSLRTSPWKAAV